MPFWIPLMVIGAVVAAVAASSSEDEEPNNWITLVGPTSAGKSRLGNDILGRQEFRVGAEHGTTTSIDVIRFREGWSVVDTPGILDGPKLEETAASAAKRSKVIVVCLDGQMYRPTFEWLEKVLMSIGHKRPVLVVPCLTKSDLREATMPSRDRAKVWDALSAQIDTLREAVADRNIFIEDLQEGSVGKRDAVVALINTAIE